ncbi:radical SAM additional 4Fe4S-binding domain-containing protein [Desulfocapsa sulfexigens DSM 10523]|uniref:Radical SAM additional 4Fe4S-binding domain-containing protein n=1 Tax=Desulfocapsa sulfexigens (strain DSM 10523 / SB164P1) TaxID=1167006 RepID=M1NE94_DESSD|nr:radical SAM protein [Desulfocapsa sulfexigens]AGF78004.1 radical SAM additional 4Fe4S-binding domain-containing protein [Desulfocapsa sulfexigens DSM 10523]
MLDEKGFRDNEVLGISPFVFMRREKTKVVISYLPHLELEYGVLPSPAASIFSLLDGKRTVGEVVGIISFLSGLPITDSRKQLMEVLNYITPDGKMLIRDAVGKIVKRFNPSDFIIPAQHLDMKTRLEAPISLIFQITFNCQADCIYCYACRRKVPGNYQLATSRILELIDEMGRLGTNQVNFCGGDPFCHPDVIEIIAHALKLGIVVDMSTKAFLDKQIVRRLEEVGLDYLQVSVDAANSSTGDLILGRSGQHARIIKTLENLRDTQIFTRTNSIITQHNFDQLEDIIITLRDLGICEMKFSPAFRSMNKDNNSILLGENQLLEFDDKMNWLANKYGSDGITIFHNRLPEPTMMSDQERAHYWLKDRPSCSSGRSSLIIAPDGKVSICEEVPQNGPFLVGDLTDSSLESVWNSQELKELAYPRKENFKNSSCYECDNFEFCVMVKGHCFKDTYKAYGRLFTTNPFCPKAAPLTTRLY